MRLFLFFFAYGLTVVVAHQPADLFDAFQAFVQSLVKASVTPFSPNNSILADNCVGRINMMMTLDGIESNTEYLYGVPNALFHSNATQLVGFPVNATVESLSIQQSIVSAAVVFSLYHSTIAVAIPVIVDVWLRFNDDLRIEAYDLSARRWDRAFAFLKPALTMRITREMDLMDDPNTTAIAVRAATDVCRAATEHCSGVNEQYPSYDECFDQLSKLDFSEDTNLCRYMHKDMVPFRPDVHCPSLGPSGGITCAQQPYVDATTAFPFPGSLVSANVTADGTDGLSEETMIELIKINMLQVYPTTVSSYAISTFLYFLLLYVSGRVVEMAFMRYSKVFRALTFENRRNTVTYAMNSVYTTVALVLQLVASPMLAEKYTVTRMEGVRLAAMIVSALYLYELIYRPSMRWPLLIHHFCTLFAIIFLQISLQMSKNPAILAAGSIWLFQATTEQTVFISLLLYRLRFPKNVVQWNLKFAAIQSFFFKIGFAIYLVVWWGMKMAKYHKQIDVALSVMLVLIVTLLMATQVYGSWAVWCIAINMDRKNPKEPAKESFVVDSEAGLKLDAPNLKLQRVETESLMSTPHFVVGRESSHFNPYEDSPGSSVEALGLRNSVPGLRDSVSMFGSSERTRLGTERMSYNRGELPM